MTPTTKAALTIIVASVSVASAGCGGSNEKADVPKNLSQPLPPPPVGMGGGNMKKGNDPAPSSVEQ